MKTRTRWSARKVQRPSRRASSRRCRSRNSWSRSSLRGTDLASVDGRARLAELARPLLARVPPGVYHELLLDRLAGEVRMPAARLAELLRARPAAGRSSAPAARPAGRTGRPPRSAGRQPLLTQAIMLAAASSRRRPKPGRPARLAGRRITRASPCCASSLKRRGPNPDSRPRSSSSAGASARKARGSPSSPGEESPGGATDGPPVASS